jgi:3-deoxy-D-manno-octulosonate 8-phosphate phosphatase (KDO 8-P phosphatase)
LAELGLDWSTAAAMGDDWPDLPMLRRAALACAPPGAHAEVLALAHWVTPRPAGAGAVRDLCDLLLVASGRYASELEAAGR